MASRLFPVLLSYWRKRRGLSQLDLAVEADVSARHVAFLETGRAQPSEAMVLRLFSVLRVPFRAQNEALRAAGFEARFPEPPASAIAPEIDRALEKMMVQQEPYPLTVLAGDLTVLRKNRAAERLFGAFVAEPERLPPTLDMFTLLFDPRFMRPFVVDWPVLARSMVSRLHRDCLDRGNDERLAALLERALGYPDVPDAWRHPDFSTDVGPTETVRLARGELRVGFLVTVTVFSAPRQVTLEELRVESCFPLDDETRTVCERLARGSPPSAAGPTQ